MKGSFRLKTNPWNISLIVPAPLESTLSSVFMEILSYPELFRFLRVNFCRLLFFSRKVFCACVDQQMASSSSRDSLPPSGSESHSFALPSRMLNVQLWLPEGFDLMLVPLIANEPDVTHQGALSRCLEGVCLQTDNTQKLTSMEAWSEATSSTMQFFQYRIQFGNGVDPSRLECFCNMLYGTTSLIDDEVWTENAAMFLSLPEYCSACDVFGHSSVNCRYFHGRVRTEQGFVPREHMRWFINSPLKKNPPKDGRRLFASCFL